ncbi:hypothetical protein [Ornithinimicrobium pekingense]|nr:hypothetical protein [Ornithinimicrobium pekingense]
MANDITLRKAAVVVYDRSFGSRLPLDYVLTIRGVGPVVIVEAPPARAQLDRPLGNGMQSVIRPADMSLWPEGFVEPLISRISALSLRPSSHEVGEHLRCLTEQDKYADLLLTCLALLEHDLRREDLPTAVPSSPTGGVMARLRDHFGADYQVVIDAVGLRHELLQHRLAEGHTPDAPQEAVQSVPQNHLNHTSSALADVVRRRYGIP